MGGTKDVAPMFFLDVVDGRQRSLALRSDGASSPADELQWRWCCCVQQPTFEVLKGVDLQWYLLCAGDAVSPSFSSPAAMPTAAAAEIAIGRVVDALKDPKGSLCIFFRVFVQFPMSAVIWIFPEVATFAVISKFNLMVMRGLLKKKLTKINMF
jgi:hypothetical protein